MRRVIRVRQRSVKAGGDGQAAQLCKKASKLAHQAEMMAQKAWKIAKQSENEDVQDYAVNSIEMSIDGLNTAAEELAGAG